LHLMPPRPPPDKPNGTAKIYGDITEKCPFPAVIEKLGQERRRDGAYVAYRARRRGFRAHARTPETLCKSYHDSMKRFIETRGFRPRYWPRWMAPRRPRRRVDRITDQLCLVSATFRKRFDIMIGSSRTLSEADLR